MSFGALLNRGAVNQGVQRPASQRRSAAPGFGHHFQTTHKDYPVVLYDAV
jgi:hypothetical protein